ncbi:hypothetical protein K431DRAFT_154192 [Polychaeton citri CBS 116435]|uniref:Methyltransferase n=1 Tax=Polychaeton citri CBS 116435 TaxID=1314669 RepID=A0A9P4USZ3_9PEZI|nr:hypothetical protein K431DRAFT_154192 [Polychaeton citri CBS 116435]
MAIQIKYQASWFYDTENGEYQSDGDFSNAELTRRPWKAFWPPKSEDTFGTWLRCEHPEVLSWRFSYNRPFDQPWRLWRKSPTFEDENKTARQYIRKNSKRVETTSTSIVNTNIEELIAGLSNVRVHSIRYLVPLETYKIEKPFFSQLPCGTQLRRTNLVESEHTVVVHDVDRKAGSFKLDESGFQFEYLPTQISEWTDANIQSRYVPEVASWLKRFFNCEKVIVYNYNLRTSDEAASSSRSWKAPIFRVHCDNTPESCARRLEFQLPDEAAEILKGRYRYIDVWRCIVDEAVDSPLALCDYRSIATTDLWKVDIVYPHFCDEGYEMTYNPDHRWFYKKGISKDDVVLFKLGDNSSTAAKFSPHTAFIDPSASSECKRASIELRAIIVG